MTLPVRVGTEWVTGRIAPMTPNGAYSSKRNATVTAHRIGLEPLGAGHVLGDEQLADLVVEPADLGLFHFEATPWLGIRHGQSLDDFNDLGAAGDSEFFQLEMRVERGLCGFIHAGEDSTSAGIPGASAATG